VAERAAAAARRHRRGRTAAGVAALAVAAVAVTGVVVDRSGAPGSSPGVTDRVHDDPIPTTWRTEYWHDLQVDVPADWGWGGAPAPGYDGDGPIACGAVAMVAANGEKLRREDPTMPYVGRPISQTDLCAVGIEDETPQAPYVWLGAAVKPGTVELGDGYVQQTVEVNGSTVTVAAQGAELRRRILDSATGGETCLSELEGEPDPAQSPGADGPAGLRPESLTVCSYRADEQAGTLGLTYAAVLDRAHARELVDAVEASPRVVPGCTGQRGWEHVVLRVEGTGPGGGSLFREYVVDFTPCDGLRAPGGGRVALTPATVEPWATGGVPATVTGTYGADGELAGYFIGMQG
jgi:hypothetical protein